MNITPGLLSRVATLLDESTDKTAKELVFYVYAVLCSQVYLDEFEGALFTVNQSDKRARVPLVADKNCFLAIADLGKQIATLEKYDYTPENILAYDYEAIKNEVPSGFHLNNSAHPFDAENEKLILSDGTTNIEIDCPLSLQRLNISGYDVIKSVWLKFNSYDFTHCDFTKEDIVKLLDFLNTIATHERLVVELDELIAPILSGKTELIENDGQ